MSWRDRAEDLLYEGETVEDAVEWDGASVVVTSHRVLAFTPETEGANFSQVDRPNVDGIETGARSRSELLERGVRYGVIGAILVVAGITIDMDSILGDVDLGAASTSQVGVGLGGIMGVMGRMLGLLRNLDSLMQTFGALGLVLAAVLLGVYWFTRTPTLTIEVAGGDDIHVPRPDDGTGDRLRHLLAGA
ncbi:MAG: hypothetical protein ABEH56_04090 [Salinirussus sp.]